MPETKIEVKEAPTHSRKATNLLGVGIPDIQPKTKPTMQITKRDAYMVEIKKSEKCIIL